MKLKNNSKLKKYKPKLKININDYDNLEEFKPGFMTNLKAIKLN